MKVPCAHYLHSADEEESPLPPELKTSLLQVKGILFC